MEGKRLLKIGEIAKLLDLPISTIRFYSDLGLLEVEARTAGGFRLYDFDKTSLKVKRIKELLEKGYTIPQIKTMLQEIGEKQKILVVDDEKSVGDFFKELFSDYSVELNIAYDGFQAGMMINEFRPDLIILDLLLPGVDGFEICRQVKSNPKTNSIKILAITAYDTPEHRDKIQKAGADDYFAKPLNLEALLEKINKLIPLKKVAKS